MCRAAASAMGAPHTWHSVSPAPISAPQFRQTLGRLELFGGLSGNELNLQSADFANYTDKEILSRKKEQEAQKDCLVLCLLCFFAAMSLSVKSA